MQITTPSRARHLDEYTQNVLEEETRYDDTDWLTLMMIYSGTGFLADANAKDKNNRPGAYLRVLKCCGAFVSIARGRGSFLCRV